MPDTVKEIRHDGYVPRRGTNTLLQRDAQEDCGQRSLSILYLIQKYGIDLVEKCL